MSELRWWHEEFAPWSSSTKENFRQLVCLSAVVKYAKAWSKQSAKSSCLSAFPKNDLAIESFSTKAVTQSTLNCLVLLYRVEAFFIFLTASISSLQTFNLFEAETYLTSDIWFPSCRLSRIPRQTKKLKIVSATDFIKGFFIEGWFSIITSLTVRRLGKASKHCQIFSLRLKQWRSLHFAFRTLWRPNCLWWDFLASSMCFLHMTLSFTLKRHLDLHFPWLQNDPWNASMLRTGMFRSWCFLWLPQKYAWPPAAVSPRKTARSGHGWLDFKIASHLKTGSSTMSITSQSTNVEVLPSCSILQRARFLTPTRWNFQARADRSVCRSNWRI